MKKQYDTHVQFWSEKQNRVIIACCGSLFIGHCTAGHLVSHFKEFGNRLKWDPKYLLLIGVDGQNVNLSFERKYSTKFLKLGSCSLHHVHNTFQKALQKLDIGPVCLRCTFFLQAVKCKTRGLCCLGRSD